MGLLDNIISGAASALANSTGNAAGNTQAGLNDVLGGLLGGSSSAGGLGALISAFEQNGLGNIISSWIGTGQNLPISGDQLSSVLGSEQLQDIAQKLGLPAGAASGVLASVLPQIIDRLTPNGQVPQGGDLLEQGLDILKGFGAR